MSHPRLLGPALLLLSACATGPRDSYPSLAPRAGEEQGFAEPDPPALAPVVADPALDIEIAQGRDALAANARTFESAATRAEAAARAAKGDAAGSDRWLDAQTALAELDALRAEAGEVVATLERLAIDRAATLAPDYPALTSAQDAARAQVTAQAARIDAIQRQLPAA